MRFERCVCCDSPIPADEQEAVRTIWETRLDGYCQECALQRCDAYPGECDRVRLGV